METWSNTAGRFEIMLRNPDGFLGSPRSRVSDPQLDGWTLGHTELALPTLSGAYDMSPSHKSGRMPTKLHGNKSLGGVLTEDLGRTGLVPSEGVGRSTHFEGPVLYKHGSNLTLHQWDDCADVLVSCQSQQQESFICQYGISAGSLSWSINITRTCDMLWVGVTANPMLNCECWIGDQPDTFVVSEEATMLAAVHASHSPPRPDAAADEPFPALLNYEPGAGHMLRDVHDLNIGGIWSTVSLTLNMSTRELWMEVGDGRAGVPTRSVLVFYDLPAGRTLYPCLSLCNAGQIVFKKHVNDV